MNETFLAIVREHLKFLPAGVRLGPDSPLRDYGLDSMAAVSLVVDLEDEFRVQIPDSRLTAEALSTPGRLWEALQASSPAPL